MIGHYLSSNNEMCYSTKTQTFSRTKHSPVLSFFLRRIKNFDFSGKKHSKFRLEPFLLCSPSLRLRKPQIHLSNDFPYRINAWKRVYLMHPDDVWVPDELHGRDLSLYLQLQTSRASKSETRPRGQRANLTIPTNKRVTTHASQRTRTRRDQDARAHLPATAGFHLSFNDFDFIWR